MRSESEVTDQRLDYLKKADLTSLNVSTNHYNSPFGYENENYLFTMDGDVLEMEPEYHFAANKSQGQVFGPNPIPIDLNGIKESIIGQRITLVQQFIKRGITLEVEISLFRQERVEQFNYGAFETLMDAT